MKALSDQLSPILTSYLNAVHNVSVNQFEFQHTRKEFTGDITLVVFSLLRHIKANPVDLGQAIGAHLTATLTWVTGFSVVKGFLNLSISDSFYVEQLNQIALQENYGHQPLDKNKGAKPRIYPA